MSAHDDAPDSTGAARATPPGPDAVRSSLYTIDGNDPVSRLVDRADLTPADVSEISQVMQAFGKLREAEQKLSDASLRYMKLGRSDMRALHFIIVSRNMGELATPSGIAHHLGISTASTTKLLDRLESAGHIERQRHPHDRRALAIVVTPDTETAAMRSMGTQQARRVRAAARLTPQERRTVIRFLEDMAGELDLRHAPWAAEGQAAGDPAASSATVADPSTTGPSATGPATGRPAGHA